jgi:hypothetical protein
MDGHCVNLVIVYAPNEPCTVSISPNDHVIADVSVCAYREQKNKLENKMNQHSFVIFMSEVLYLVINRLFVSQNDADLFYQRHFFNL